MICEKCGYETETTMFLGTPTREWFEIMKILDERGAPGQSPLSILSILIEQNDMAKSVGP